MTTRMTVEELDIKVMDALKIGGHLDEEHNSPSLREFNWTLEQKISVVVGIENYLNASICNTPVTVDLPELYREYLDVYTDRRLLDVVDSCIEDGVLGDIPPWAKDFIDYKKVAEWLENEGYEDFSVLDNDNDNIRDITVQILD